MADTDRHEAMIDFRGRLRDMEKMLHILAASMADAVKEMQATLTTAIQRLDERALQDAKAETQWQTEHARAVESCKAHGTNALEAIDKADDAMVVANSALTLATQAHSEAVEARTTAANAARLTTLAGKPLTRTRAELAAYIALAGTLVNAIVEWLSRH